MAITILFLSANPIDTPTLELIKESNAIADELQYTGATREKFNFEQRHDITLRDLRKQILTYKPEILHFSGHGSPRSALIFKNQNGETEVVPPQALSNLFEILGKDISLVFLNACYSEEQAKAISAHVDFVIGMSRAISDEAARLFAVSFYSSLGFGKNVKDAFNLAKVDLQLLSIPDEATPKLLINKKASLLALFQSKKVEISKEYVCECIKNFKGYQNDLESGTLPLPDFWSVVGRPISQWLSDENFRRLVGEPKAKGLGILIMYLSVIKRAYYLLMEDQKLEEAQLKAGEAMKIIRQMINYIDEICNPIPP